MKKWLGLYTLTRYELSHNFTKMAEGVGFEPTKLSFAGFQDYPNLALAKNRLVIRRVDLRVLR